MHILSAKRRPSDGRWDFTRTEHGIVSSVGYCAEVGGGHHDSEQEARACYRRFLLDRKLDLEADLGPAGDRECLICAAPTTKAACVDLTHSFPLCEDHRTREAVEGFFPLPISVTTSW